MLIPFITIFALIFFIVTWRRFEWGIFLLFLLLPTYLIRFHVGPLPSTLLEVMVLCLLGIFCLRQIPRLRSASLGMTEKKERNLIQTLIQKNKLLVIGVSLFLTAATISIFTSVNIRAAAGEWRAFYLEPVLIFFVLTLYLKNLETKKRKNVIQNYILFPLILCGLVTSVLAIYQHFTGWLVPYAFWANRATYRVTAWYGFPNAVGLFLAPIIPLALYLVKEKWNELKTQNWKLETRNVDQINSKFQLAISLIFLFCALLGIAFAKGSGPMIGVAAGIGILLLAYKKTRIPALTLAVLGLIGIIFLPSSNPIKQEIFATNYSGELRRDIWSETLQLLKDRPLTGAGIASYEERIVPYRADHWIEVFHHPHNIFLTLWVNIGLFGLLGFVLILTWFCITAIKNIHTTKFFLASMGVILVMGLVDSPYIKNDLAILFWLLPTLLLSQIPSYKK
jgi:O-antigen ligase